MSYEITCVDRRYILGQINPFRITRTTVKTVDTKSEAMEYCWKRNSKGSPIYMGEDVYHFFTPMGDEEE